MGENPREDGEDGEEGEGDDGGGSVDGDENTEPTALDPRPNLVVSAIGGDPAVTMRDGVLTVAALVQNVGDGEARDVSVAFAANPAAAVIPLDAPVVASRLAPGEEMRVEARYGADAGAGLYSFQVVADPDNRIRELDEGDNILRAELQLR